jgi:hypothetical protein
LSSASPPPPDASALDSEDKLRAEMEAAGFIDVEIHRAEHAFTMSAAEPWASVAEGFAPVAEQRLHMEPAAWAAADQRAQDWLHR